MKKIIYMLFAVMTLAFGSSAFANVSEASISQPVPIGSAAVCDFMPTCLNIYNESSFPIGIRVPALSFVTTLYPYYMQPVQASDYNSKRVILSDWLGYIFYDAYVPNHFDIYVYDFNGKASVKFSK